MSVMEWTEQKEKIQEAYQALQMIMGFMYKQKGDPTSLNFMSQFRNDAPEIINQMIRSSECAVHELESILQQMERPMFTVLCLSSKEE